MCVGPPKMFEKKTKAKIFAQLAEISQAINYYLIQFLARKHMYVLMDKTKNNNNI